MAAVYTQGPVRDEASAIATFRHEAVLRMRMKPLSALAADYPGVRPERFGSLLEEHTQALLPGDVIVLYTDGITEAMDGESELFGESALARVVGAHTDLDAPAIRERVLREVRSFVGDAEPHDDMTMVVLKIVERREEQHAA